VVVVPHPESSTIIKSCAGICREEAAMTRFPMLSPNLLAPRALSRWLALGGLLLVAAPSAASDIVIADVPILVRKFPEGFCPLPVTVPFTPTSTTATIHFAADAYVLQNAVPVYTEQAIDNIAVVPTTVHASHLTANNSFYEFCYIPPVGQVAQLFMIDANDLGSVPLIERFASGASGWDLSQDCYFDISLSAYGDLSVSPHTDNTGGSLRLGTVKGSPSVPDVARTSYTLTGLTPGLSYTLSGFWRAVDGIATDTVTLKIQVTEPESTPIRGGSWGSLKIHYR
jgi:hypothetical protein